MALAMLALDYCTAHGGSVLGLVVDHGLRLESEAEALLTASRLKSFGVACQCLKLDLRAGPALQERARAARYQALGRAAQAAGFVYLALGHHQADQHETVAMRMRRGGGTEGMAAWTARGDVVLLRPLLSVEPALLRAFLLAQGVTWIEDPSNQLRRFERVRIRQDQEGHPPKGAAERALREQEVANFLARYATLSPQGFALLDTNSPPALALGALIRTIGGRLYAPKHEALNRLASGLRPATLGGVRIMPAGRLGAGWLLTREPAACAPPVEAIAQARWDDRFTLRPKEEWNGRVALNRGGMKLGALGAQARLFKGYERLPNVVLQGLPALRDAHGDVIFPAPVRFMPPVPVTQRPFQQ